MSKADLDVVVNPAVKAARGVVYSAVTARYAREVVKSAQAVKKFHPDLPITVFSDQCAYLRKFGTLFDKIKKINMAPMKAGKFKLVPFAKLSKIRAMASMPYKSTLYLDTDTKVVKPILELFNYTTKFDIIIANSPKLDKSRTPYKLAGYQWKNHYNSGVVLYRDSALMAKLFRQWIALVKADRDAYAGGKGKFYDQPKLVKLLNHPKREVKLKVVPNTIYNARHTMIDRLKRDKLWGKVKIIHKHGA